MSDSKSPRPYQGVPTLRTGHANPHPEPLSGESYSAVELMPAYRVVVLDQRKLPALERYEFFTRVDVTEEFPFLVTKLSPYFDRY